jgi:predicted GNAT family acetyltransferase
MRLTRFADAAAFLNAAERFLSQHEVENCLPLGIAGELIERPDLIRNPPYLAAVTLDGGVIATGVMTLPGRLIVAYAESSAALRLIAEDVRGFGTPITSVIGNNPAPAWFVEHWQALTGHLAQPGMSERLYQLTRVNHPRGVPGRARRATRADRGLLIEWFGDFEREVFGSVSGDIAASVDSIFERPSRGMCLWEDREPVSMAGFRGRTPHGLRIGPVYTPPSFRGHGYASACIARLSQDLLDSGRRFCCLFTDLANPTSNHIYQVIGYQPVSDVQEYRFTSHPGE